MKKLTTFILLVLISTTFLLNGCKQDFIKPIPECKEDSDCKPSACGDCINIRIKDSRLCDMVPTGTCRCENNKCVKE